MYTVIIQNTTHFYEVILVFYIIRQYQLDDNLSQYLNHCNLFNNIVKVLLNYITIMLFLNCIKADIFQVLLFKPFWWLWSKEIFERKALNWERESDRLHTLSPAYSYLNTSFLPCIICILLNTVQVQAHSVSFSHQAALVSTGPPRFINHVKSE